MGQRGMAVSNKVSNSRYRVGSTGGFRNKVGAGRYSQVFRRSNIRIPRNKDAAEVRLCGGHGTFLSRR